MKILTPHPIARPILYFLGFVAGVHGAWMLLSPQHWFDAIPGVDATGPFNAHLVRDVGFAFVVSGMLMAWGAFERRRFVALAGTLWLCFHAVYHLYLWLAHGMTFDQVALVNLVGIQLPAWLGFLCAVKVQR